MAEIFISYSRKDSTFVRRLHNAFAAENREAWVDWEINSAHSGRKTTYHESKTKSLQMDFLKALGFGARGWNRTGTILSIEGF
jgi:hypothetical protein